MKSDTAATPPTSILSSAQIASLREDLSGIPQITDAKQVRLKSRDFHWYSPALKEQLANCLADVVVQPRDEAEVVRVVAAAARRRVPITVRGGGTGNYGQCVPLKGGIVLDMTRMEKVLSVAPGCIRSEAGAKISDVLAAAEETGQQLLMFPSTLKIATIGGFVAGGRGGIGSVRHGILRESGALLAVKVVTVEETPRVLTLRGEDAAAVHHAWGTNGVILEVEFGLVPAQEWIHCIAVFTRYVDALKFGSAVMTSGIDVFLLSAVDGRFKQYYEDFGPYFTGAAAVFSMVNRTDVENFSALVARFGGRQSLALGQAEMELAGLPLVHECAFNHTTLRALRLDASWTYLQLVMPSPLNPVLVEMQMARYGDEVLMHHEFARSRGAPRVAALPLVRFTTSARLADLMQQFSQDGLRVINVHLMRHDDSDINDSNEMQQRFKREADPLNLMNPGK